MTVFIVDDDLEQYESQVWSLAVKLIAAGYSPENAFTRAQTQIRAMCLYSARNLKSVINSIE